ncbi:MAG: hypothetical protein RSA61_05755 [Acidaminococcaceae bacterium]
MKQVKNGFIMLEVVAAVCIASTALLAVLTCYRGTVGLMQRHNLQLTALSLAAEEMELVGKNGAPVGASTKTVENLVVQTQVTLLSLGHNLRQVEVRVYSQPATPPLVSLSCYEQ